MSKKPMRVSVELGKALKSACDEVAKWEPWQRSLDPYGKGRSMTDAQTRIEEGMTPELEAKARELDCWARRLSAYWPLTSWNHTHEWEKTERVQERLEFYRRELEQFSASQLSTERKWWIERIEQERDKYETAFTWNLSALNQGGYIALRDLLTSVRERVGK